MELAFCGHVTSHYERELHSDVHRCSKCISEDRVMWPCAHCGKETRKVIACDAAFAESPKDYFRCDNCHECSQSSAFNYQLHQTVAKDKFGTKVTAGKAWEMDNRVRSQDDGKTIVNKVTGKPAQR